MSFLAPLFLLGALGLAAPVLFHLIRRTTREVTPFSTLMFLQPTPPRVTRRSRLENLWLLLLRCAAIALLALAFARPFWPKKSAAPVSPAGASKRMVILVDVSASMRRENLWELARLKVEELIRGATPGDELALVAFDRQVRPLVSFEDWKALDAEARSVISKQRLDGLSPGWGSTSLDTALLHAAQLLDQPAEESPGAREIMVVSDLQEGSRLDGVQGYEWPPGVRVTFAAVKTHDEQNAGLQWLSEQEEAVNSAEETPLRLRITAAVEERHEQFQVRWADAAADDERARINVYLTSGRSQIVRAPMQPKGSTSLVLSGDKAEFDNTVFVLPADNSPLPLLFLGQDGEDDPRGSLYYVRRGFPQTRRQSVQIAVHSSDQSVPAFQLQEAQLILLAEGTASAPLASAREFARGGRTVVVPMTSAASAETLARLLDLPSVPVTEAQVKDYALLGQIDFQHPLFAPFADPRFSDFTKIHFWKYRQVDETALPGAKVIARFDRGGPAIVEVPLGKGRIILFTSSWRPVDSQLALSSKFVPLLHALLEQSSNLPVRKAQYFVGDEVPLPAEAPAVTIRKPDATEVVATAKFLATDQPGIYQVLPGAGRFVVNLAPEESRTAVLTPDRFTSLGVPLTNAPPVAAAKAAREETRAKAAELENRQKLWRWLIAAALGVLLLETLFAGRLSQTITTANGTRS